jgi:hypothetical protein
MADIGIDGARLSGALQLTWMSDHLAHILEHSQTDEPSGTWTGLACPGHGLALGADVDTTTLQRLFGSGDVADIVWEASTDLTAEHGRYSWAPSRPVKQESVRSASDSGSRPRLSGPRRGHRTTRHSSSCKPQARSGSPRSSRSAG